MGWRLASSHSRITPKPVLSGKAMQLITSTEERLRRLAATGTDYCILLDFTPQMAQMSAHDFTSYS